MVSMNKWRVIQDEWNLRARPWSGSVGIEEVPDDGILEVPSIVCWFTRGWDDPDSDDQPIAQHIVDMHNEWLEKQKAPTLR